ncbi:MAG: GNAT family N-acetyltransferase [Anaerolineae bacterium]|nr:GNAT family N-acetyltransferase [Anaerolineae bacterium]
MLSETIKVDPLLLRPYQLYDVEAVLSFASDPEWARYLPIPQPYTYSDAEAFIASQILLDKELHQSWAITDEDKPIGGINIRFDVQNRAAEIGYSIARPYWGRGFMTQVAGAVINTAFETYLELHRIRAMADARNSASLRVMEKLGMSREGHLRQNRWLRGKFIDEVWCGLLRYEWANQRASSTNDKK